MPAKKLDPENTSLDLSEGPAEKRLDELAEEAGQRLCGEDWTGVEADFIAAQQQPSNDSSRRFMKVWRREWKKRENRKERENKKKGFRAKRQPSRKTVKAAIARYQSVEALIVEALRGGVQSWLGQGPSRVQIHPAEWGDVHHEEFWWNVRQGVGAHKPQEPEALPRIPNMPSNLWPSYVKKRPIWVDRKAFVTALEQRLFEVGTTEEGVQDDAASEPAAIPQRKTPAKAKHDYWVHQARALRKKKPGRNLLALAKIIEKEAAPEGFEKWKKSGWTKENIHRRLKGRL